MSTEKGIEGYINYKVWEFLNKFKERHRQKTLRRLLIDGALLAVNQYRREHPDAEYKDLKEVVKDEMQRLRDLAEGDTVPFGYNPITIDKKVSKEQRNALYAYLDAYSNGQKPVKKTIASENGISPRTLKRWEDGWREIDTIKNILEEAERVYEINTHPIVGKADYEDKTGDARKLYYGCSMKYDVRKTAF